MILKKQIQASETRFDGQTILEYQVDEIIYDLLNRAVAGLDIPGQLIREIKLFAGRNSLIFESYSIHSNRDETVKVCCKQCLKAHALQKAKYFDLSNEVLDLIDDVFSCETGHSGYYLDKEELVKSQ